MAVAGRVAIAMTVGGRATLLLSSRCSQIFPVCLRQVAASRSAWHPYSRRWLSVNTALHVAQSHESAPGFPEHGPADSVVDIFESSAKARWAEDAVNLSDLAPQGDLASLGLGGYSPSGLVQTALDMLHQTGLPWWSTIVVCTVVLRLLMFPLAVKMHANSARMNNIQPEIEKLQTKIKQHKQAGNEILAAQVMVELLQLYKKHNCNPFKMMLVPLVQIPVFISFFMALRGMSAVPVESMKMGGILWFTDLTVPDPFYILPILGVLSFMANLELGGEAGVTNPQTEKFKTAFRVMAIVMVPVTATFPSSLFMYWITASMFSTGQILLLKIAWMRRALGIPDRVKHERKPEDELKKGGFFAALKENYRSAQVIDTARKKEIAAKRAYNEQLKDTSPKLYDEPPHRRRQ